MTITRNPNGLSLYGDPTQRNHLFQNGAIFLDTNILAGIASLRNDSAKQMIDLLRKFKDRIYVTATIYSEFQALVETLVQNQQKKLDQFERDIDTKFIIGLKGYLKDSYGMSDKELASLTKSIQNMYRNYKKEHGKEEVREIALDMINDPPFNVLTKLDSNALLTIYSQGKKRYALSIPPGFGDANKVDSSKYNDLVIFCEMQKFAGTSKKDILFITKDTGKGDWVKKSSQVEPLVALVTEFQDNTSQHFWLSSLDDLLHTLKADRKLINEIKSQNVESSVENLTKVFLESSDNALRREALRQRIKTIESLTSTSNLTKSSEWLRDLLENSNVKDLV